MSKKTYEAKQIQQILAEAAKEGDKTVRARYKLSNATLAVWRRKMSGSHVQVVSRATKALVDPERKRLEAENAKLKAALSERLLDDFLNKA